MSETAILKDIHAHVAETGARMFRNNTALAWAGQVERLAPGRDVFIRNARPIHCGLVVGAADLIGWVPVIVTAEMVGKTVAVFAAVEVKTPTGRLAETQRDFLTAVIDAGGRAGVARTVAEAEQILRPRGGLE